MSHKRFTSTKGFTLIELTIYIAMVVGLLLVATSFAWNIINSRSKAFTVQEVEQNGRLIMEKFSQAARQATDITMPAVGASGTSVSFTMKESAKSPTVFMVSGNNITFKEGSGAAIQLNADAVQIQSGSFSNMSTANGRTKQARFILTIKHTNPTGMNQWKYSDTFETSVELLDR